MAYKPLILTDPTDYAAIRAMARMNEARLSNDMILSWGYLPAVEARLAKAIPTYTGLSGTDLVLLKSAATKLVAAIAVRTIPDSEKSLDYSYSQASEKMAVALEQGADEDISGITVVGASLEDASSVAAVVGPTRTRKAGDDWLDVGGVIQ